MSVLVKNIFVSEICIMSSCEILYPLDFQQGSWGLKSSLDELLGIDSKECLRILMSNGLGSLGKSLLII